MPSSSSSSVAAAPFSGNGTRHSGGSGSVAGCLPADQACFVLSSSANSSSYLHASATTTRRDASTTVARACCTTASYVVVLGISFGSLLAILLILCVIRWYLVWRSARPRQDDGTVDEAVGSAKKRSAGLDDDAIAALPVFAYKQREEGGGGGVVGAAEEEEEEQECTVCLAVMADGEAARRLPRCMHVFHRGCVDVWLKEHSTCPVCRAEVVVRAAGTARVEKLPESSASRALTSPVPAPAPRPTGTVVDDSRERDLEAQQ
uniref:RING-type E3 ubiquitin transferase n=1 Tax=Oryza meridionalis TaxID=40149 RepID=A0A0E0DN96_9ORYZ